MTPQQVPEQTGKQSHNQSQTTNLRPSASLNNENLNAEINYRLPPQSLEAEMCTLGSMVLDRDCIGEIVLILQTEQFYRQEHRLIFDALIGLYDQRKPVDIVLLRDELKSRGQLEQVGGVDYLVSLVESVPSAVNAEYYAKIVRDKALLRNLISAAGEISLIAYEDRGDVAETLDVAEHKIFEVTEMRVSGRAVSMRDVMARVFEVIQDREAGITGLATGFLELDELTSGLQDNEMIVVAARPSMGKTALGLNIAEHVGADNKIPVALFSLEMAAQQLAERMLCGRSHVDSQNLRKGFLSEQDYTKLQNTANELSDAPIFVDDSPGLTPLEMRAKARRLKMQYDIRLIVIDYLQLMHCPGTESRQQEVTTISRYLKALARELCLPVLVMSQLNRSPEGREGHRPRMSDLRESGAIEQDADVVMLLHREDYYHNEPDWEKTNSAELIIAKQRNGPTGNVNLLWQPHWTRFENLASSPEPFGI